MALTVSELAEGVRVARVDGELDTFNARRVGDELRPRAGDSALVVDVSNVTFVDSAGLHTLFRVARVALDTGTTAAFVVPPSSPVARAIQIVGLGNVAPVYESLEEALAHHASVT